MKEHCRINLPPKEVLLKDECKQMYSELKRKAPEITFSKLNLKDFEKNHIGEKKGIKEGDFFFNSKKEVDDTVSELFMNEYNLHMLSHRSVLLDARKIRDYCTPSFLVPANSFLIRLTQPQYIWL